MTARINAFDQDTLDHLKDAGVSDELLTRVQLTMQECADYHAAYGDPPAPKAPAYRHRRCPWCGEGKNADHTGCSAEYQARYGVALPAIA